MRDQSLGTTLALGFMTLLVMLAGVVSYVLHGLSTARLQRQVMVRELLPASDAAAEIALGAARYEFAVQGYADTGSAEDWSAARRSQAALRRAAIDLQQVPLRNREDSYLSSQIQGSVEQLQRQIQEFENMATGRSPDGVRVLVNRYLRSTAASTVDLAARLRARLDHRADEFRVRFAQRDEQLARSLVWAFGLTSLVGVVLALFCVRLITEPVGRLSLAARAVEKGDYSLALRLQEQMPGAGHAATQNELTILGRAFAHMAQVLEERESRLLSQAERLMAANSQLQALQSLTDVALADLPIEELLQQLFERVIAGVGGHTGSVFLTDPTSGHLQRHCLARRDLLAAANRSTVGSQELAAQVMADGKLVVCNQLQADSDEPQLAARGVGAYLAVPIRLREEIVGAAHVEFDEPQAFTPTAVNLMQVFAERLERAIERARAVEEMEARRRDLERQVAQQQQQLLRSERMASIGHLGAGIAHELRNPLGVISNAVYFLRHHSHFSDSKAIRHLEIIEREVRQSVRIINSLVDYSDGIEPETSRLDLNALIRAALEYSPVPEEVRVEYAPAAGMPGIIGDESQLLQAVEHLLRNAVQAMEGGGLLQISTGIGGDTVWAAIQDSGPGVLPENQSHIFEPLITTRAKGLGLGLAIVKKIVEAHGGAIHLVSEPGEGARFILELPLTEQVMLSTRPVDGLAS